MKLLIVTAMLLVVDYVDCYAGYQIKIPNGDNVPHPCKTNFLWKGVGHKHQYGGGDRNQFGMDFKAAGMTWTKVLCEKDSDGDGKSNGVELGDPNCIWTPGTVPELTRGITHPGICDPWGSSRCSSKNDWVTCDVAEFNCPAIHEEGVLTKELRFPLTKVPAKVTTYICMSFELPSDDDYHLIATTPIINETQVMHHLLLFGCDDNVEFISAPRECNMGGCSSQIGGWSVGIPGECHYKEMGFRMGQKGVKIATIQFHWNNPDSRDDLWDSSGITIYYTKNLRKYDAATFSTGQVYLEIPPLTPKVVQHSTCPSRCTERNFNGSIFVTSGINHMHYLGIGGSVKLTRQDGSELMMTNDQPYSYDNPVFHDYDPPIEVKSGDSLETVCTYRSISRMNRTHYGEGTFDEMCFSFFNFFPAQAIKPRHLTCYEMKNLGFCDFEDWDCDISTFRNLTHPDTKAMVNKVMAACSYRGECLYGCRAVSEEIFKTHNCLKKERRTYSIGNFIDSNEGRGESTALEALRFITALRSCETDTENPIEYETEILTGAPDSTDSSFQICSSLITLVGSFLVGLL